MAKIKFGDKRSIVLLKKKRISVLKVDKLKLLSGTQPLLFVLKDYGSIKKMPFSSNEKK